MTEILLPLLQGAGSVALALVAFALAFTWPSLMRPILGLRTDGARAIAFSLLGVALLLAAAVVYVIPGALLRDPLGLLLAFPVAALWLMAAASLVVRGIVVGGAVRGVSYAFAVVAAAGTLAGIASALLAQRGITDTVTPTGAFLLAVGGLAAVILWARAEDPQQRPRRHSRTKAV